MIALVVILEFLDNLYRFPFILLPIAGGILSVGLFIMLIHLVRDSGFIKMQLGDWADSRRQTPIPIGKLTSRWKGIKKHMETDSEAEWRTAVIGADAILDEVIKSAGYKGETMGERLKNIKPYQFPGIDDAWRAHKIRNFLAHDAEYKLSRQVAEGTMEIYERIFRELGVL